MNILKDNGIISEIACGNSFEYVLEDNHYFLNTDYKVLQSQTKGIFVKCMKMTRNGKLDLYYITNDYRTMSSMFLGITADTLITIIINLFASIIEVRNNGFLVCQCIELSWDKIFVEQNTFKVKLVYLPLSVKIYDSYSEFESELRSNVVKLINQIIIEPNERLTKLVQDLCNGTLSLEDVYNRSKIPGTIPIVEKEEKDVREMIKLVAINAPKPFEIPIERTEFLIGKKQELVDGVIPYSQMISRKHCRITYENGSYFVSDEGSVNGTFVNGTRVMGGQRHQIKRDDVIRLADCMFQIV